MARMDWAGMMRAGMREAGLKPAEFWSLSPAELMLILDRDGIRPLGRGGLEALLDAFPDCHGGKAE